ncbi:zinc-ribbon domain-containing protein [Cryobacterium cryoconiti]|uniref:Zinc-ribbon domain-containing protein n=1 Tax=Cryobacterium cryoconiti TaxID=1259239 RepID=A0A4Y8K186_9MICO|nr:zinc-ribbon domain-containing protein [Cryobacterium cryoconiti]TFD34124.1 zinc-ribbon domain-containing protein [Cryobacterium cryoconiti]
MLLIFGNRLTESIVNVVSFVCGYCHVEATQDVIRRSNRFTLFFISLFAFSTTYVNRCTNCGAETVLTAGQAQHSIAWAENQR